jgi:hypothetical protein
MPSRKKVRLSLATQVLLELVLGLLAGVIFGERTGSCTFSVRIMGLALSRVVPIA